MKVIPLLFEDHTLARFRPLAWSLPTYEIRVGMFSLRERVGQVLDADFSGGLLGRAFLTGLQQARGWANGPEAVADLLGAGPGVCLWLNGRGGWSHAELEDLIREAATGRPYLRRDAAGVLAFTTSLAEGTAALVAWEKWENQAAARGCWSEPALSVPPWEPAYGAAPTEAAPGALQWIWQIVPATAAALNHDLAYLRGGAIYRRELFGVNPDLALDLPGWTLPTSLAPWSDQPGWEGAVVRNPEQVWCGPQVRVAGGAVLDATAGPIILDRGVTVMPFCYLEGPLYLGAGATVKAGASVYGESSFGVHSKIAGEIGESTFGDFSNKQHDGFIGHAVLGSWVNLGAMTTCSDLKNNYGSVRVDLGAGEVDSRQRFVGLLMGDHAKTAIGTLFNTGTSVGFATNIFGGVMPPKFVANFRWGGEPGCPEYAVGRALETAEVVMSRRGCILTDAQRRLFDFLAG